MEVLHEFDITLWNQGCFHLGETAIESLVASAHEFEAAIVVIRAEDTVTSRATTTPAARDNLWFEAGLFMGRLGRERTFVFYDSANPANVLSDLRGMTLATYDGNDENLQRAVAPACARFRREMGRINVPKEVWYTEFHFGRNLYRETLQFCEITPCIIGKKIYQKEGGAATIFRLHGFRGKGFDWLEYHTDNGDGGGALLLRHLGAGMARGLIIAGHCDTGALRCYENRWVTPNDHTYDPSWLKTVAEGIL
jgi:hypothetical protein